MKYPTTLSHGIPRPVWDLDMLPPVQVAQFIASWYYVTVYRLADTEGGTQGLELSYNNAAISKTVGEFSPDPARPS